MWFSTLCLYYYAHIHQKAGVGASSVKTNDPSNDEDDTRDEYNPPKSKNSQNQSQGNNQTSSKTDNDNLPCGVSINHTYVNPTKAKQVSVILLNTNSYNVWIRQPLYAATIWDVKLKDWDYEPIITKSKDADTFEVKLQQVPPKDLREEILSNATKTDPELDETNGKNKFKEKDERPSFGKRLNTKDQAFNFKKELERLPFELNIGNTLLTQEQQK